MLIDNNLSFDEANIGHQELARRDALEPLIVDPPEAPLLIQQAEDHFRRELGFDKLMMSVPIYLILHTLKGAITAAWVKWTELSVEPRTVWSTPNEVYAAAIGVIQEVRVVEALEYDIYQKSRKPIHHKNELKDIRHLIEDNLIDEALATFKGSLPELKESLYKSVRRIHELSTHPSTSTFISQHFLDPWIQLAHEVTSLVSDSSSGRARLHATTILAGTLVAYLDKFNDRYSDAASRRQRGT